MHVEEWRKFRLARNAAMKHYEQFIVTTPLTPGVDTPAPPPGLQKGHDELKAAEAALEAFENQHGLRR